MRKTAFFELFALCPAKSVIKQCFFTFFETLCTKFAVRQKCEKNSVFWVTLCFCTMSCKKCEKQCFFTFFETLCAKFAKNAKKQRFFFARFLRKNSVFWAFCTMSCKKCEKTVFFTFFETLSTRSARNAKKKQRFLSFLHDVLQKVW